MLVFAFSYFPFGVNAGLASAVHISRGKPQFTNQTIVDWPLYQRRTISLEVPVSISHFYSPSMLRREQYNASGCIRRHYCTASSDTACQHMSMNRYFYFTSPTSPRRARTKDRRMPCCPSTVIRFSSALTRLKIETISGV